MGNGLNGGTFQARTGRCGKENHGSVCQPIEFVELETM